MNADEMKALRKQYGISTARAAALAMVSRRRWQQWESGKHNMPAYREKLFRSGLRRIKPVTHKG